MITIHNDNNVKIIENGEVKSTVESLDTSNGTTFARMFLNCNNLANVPYMYMPKCQTFANMFGGCTSLTDNSLDNILRTCISMPFIADLSQLGFNSTDYPASRIQALPHYQDFINAGWTLGY